MKTLRFLMIGIFFASPLFASASIGTAFGGNISVIIPCTCSVGFAVYYVPLYISSNVPTAGALYYSTFTALLYSLYNPITPSTWDLGTFLPGTGEECFVGAEPDCTLYPTEGTIDMEGTSGLL